MILAQVFAATGWTGLVLLRAASVGVISGLVLMAIHLRAPGVRPRTAALLALGAFVVMAPALALRPQLLAMILFALILVLLAARQHHPRAIWAIPFLAAAWANIHGSFVLAPVLVGLALLEESGGPGAAIRPSRPGLRPMLMVLMGTIAATFVTPFGGGVWTYALGLASNREVTAQISEWQPPHLTDVPGLLFWASLALVIVAVGLLARRGHRIRWLLVVGPVGFAILGALAVRGIAWWPAVAVTSMAGVWAGAGKPGATAESDGLDGDPSSAGSAARARRGRGLNAFVALILVVAGIALVPSWRAVEPGTGAPVGVLAQAPAGITGKLRAIAGPADRVWNPQVWGSWLEFAVPGPRYALDSRIEVITAQTWRDARDGRRRRSRLGGDPRGLGHHHRDYRRGAIPTDCGAPGVTRLGGAIHRRRRGDLGLQQQPPGAVRKLVTGLAPGAWPISDRPAEDQARSERQYRSAAPPIPPSSATLAPCERTVAAMSASPPNSRSSWLS